MKSKPIPGGSRDVASALDPWVLKAPDHEALVSRFARYTYQQLDAAVNAGTAAQPEHSRIAYSLSDAAFTVTTGAESLE